ADPEPDHSNEDQEHPGRGDGGRATRDGQPFAAPKPEPRVVDVGGRGDDAHPRRSGRVAAEVAHPDRGGSLGELGQEDGDGQLRPADPKGVVGARIAGAGGTQVDAPAAGEPVGSGKAADETTQQDSDDDHACDSNHAAPAGQKRTNSQEWQADEGRGSNRLSAIPAAIDSIVASAFWSHVSSTSWL